MADKQGKVNAVVVGAGAGGGVVANELASSGLSVVLFERGGWPVYDNHINDELVNQRTFVLASLYGPDWEKNPRVMINPDGSKRILRPNGWDYNYIAACVGSGTVSYGAMAWRFMPEDFKMKSTYGTVEGSTLDDWPISYNDLESCYEKAEWEIGVSGENTGNPFAAPRKKGYPMPAFENNQEGKLLAAAAQEMGLHPFPIPMLRNSVPYNGRAGCIRNRTCVGFQCPVDAKNGTQNTVIPAAMKTGNCDVRPNCQVAEVITDERGRATGVRYFDGNDREHFQPADLVVIAASAIETARLMLNSRSKLFPDGLGNNHGWVGRNLQGHAYTGAFGLFDQDINDIIGPGATFGMCDFNHHNEGIIGGGLLCNEFHQMPYGFSQFRPPGSATWGKAHKEFQVKMYRRTATLVGPIQEMPSFESRVRVDDSVKDHWGIPVAALSGRRHSLDHEHCKFLSDKAEAIIKQAGAYKTWQWVGGRGLSGSHHQCGTTRMGDDPKTSVVNKYGQVHDVDNVFVADGSLFVTGGGFNPVLTIMALGYWVGDYIVRNWNGSKFR